ELSVKPYVCLSATDKLNCSNNRSVTLSLHKKSQTERANSNSCPFFVFGLTTTPAFHISKSAKFLTGEPERVAICRCIFLTVLLESFLIAPSLRCIKALFSEIVWVILLFSLYKNVSVSK